MTYTTPIINTDLKVPTLGITDLGYQIPSNEIQIYIVVNRYTTTYLRMQLQFNQNTYVKTLKMTYMALDNTFTPAFSMNYFFPVLPYLCRGLTGTVRQVFRCSTMSTSPGPPGFFWTPPTRTCSYPSCTTSTSGPTILPSTSILTSSSSTAATTGSPSQLPPISGSGTPAFPGSSSTKLLYRPWETTILTTG